MNTCKFCQQELFESIKASVCIPCQMIKYKNDDKIYLLTVVSSHLYLFDEEGFLFHLENAPPFSPNLLQKEMEYVIKETSEYYWLYVGQLSISSDLSPSNVNKKISLYLTFK